MHFTRVHLKIFLKDSFNPLSALQESMSFTVLMQLIPFSPCLSLRCGGWGRCSAAGVEHGEPDAAEYGLDPGVGPGPWR